MILGGDLEKVEPYLRTLADQMQLKDWLISAPPEPVSEPDAAAHCAVAYGHKSACIRFASDWAEWEPDYFREVCVHELLHCHFQPIELNLHNAQAPLGSIGFAILQGGYIDAMETCIQQLAQVIAPHMPLPDQRSRK